MSHGGATLSYTQASIVVDSRIYRRTGGKTGRLSVYFLLACGSRPPPPPATSGSLARALHDGWPGNTWTLLSAGLCTSALGLITAVSGSSVREGGSSSKLASTAFMALACLYWLALSWRMSMLYSDWYSTWVSSFMIGACVVEVGLAMPATLYTICAKLYLVESTLTQRRRF